MPPAINLTVTSDPKDMVRAIVRMQREIDKLKNKLRDTGRAAKKVKSQHQQAFGATALGGLKSYAAGLVGVGSILGAYRLISDEITRVITLQGKAAGTAKSLVASQQELLRNLVGLTKSEQAGVAGRVVGLARDTGVSQRVINRALAQTVSATGQDIPLSEASVDLAARFLADAPESIARFAGSLADISKITGTKEPLVNLGFIAKVGALSRVTDPLRQAKNIPPALVGAVGFGATPEEAGALFASISGAMVDVTGEMAGTAVIQFAKQLEEFFLEDKKILTEKLKAQFTGALTLGERLTFLQTRPEVAERFLEDVSFEVKAFAPLRSLIRGETNEQLRAQGASIAAILKTTPFVAPGIGDLLLAGLGTGIKSVSEQFAVNLGQFGSRQEQRELGRKALEARDISPLERFARIERATDVGVEQLLIQNEAAIAGGVSRKGIKDIQFALGTGALRSKAQQIQFEIQSGVGRFGAELAFQDFLEREIQALRAPTRRGPPMRGAPFEALRFAPGGVIPGLLESREPTQLEIRNAETLEAILAEVNRAITLLVQPGLEAVESVREFLPLEVTGIIQAATLALDGDTE